MYQKNRKKYKLFRNCLAFTVLLIFIIYTVRLLWYSYISPLPLAASYKKLNTIILKGSSKTGNYTHLLTLISNSLKSHFGKKYKFELDYSAGSIENIKDLQEGKSHISIVQEDVAYYFFHGGHRILKTGHENDLKIRGLLFPFNEYLFVIADPHKTSLKDLKVVNIGSSDAGAAVTSINILDQSQYTWDINTSENYEELFQKNEIDAFLILTSNIGDIVKSFESGKKSFSILSLTQSERASILASYPFYKEATVSYKDISGNEKKINTISTRALLAVGHELPEEIVQYILSLFTSKNKYKKLEKEFPELVSIQSFYWQTGELQEGEERFTNFPIPQHPCLVNLRIGKYPYAAGFFLLIPLFLTFAFLIYLKEGGRYKLIFGKKAFMGISLRVLFETFWVYLLLLNGILCYVIVSCYAIKYLEIQTFLQVQMVECSRFIEMSLDEIFTWLLVFGVTGYEDMIFPKNQLAKIIATSVPIVGIGGVMFIIGHISADYIKKIVKGEKMERDYRMKDHIVICNWNSKAESIIEEIHSPLLKEHKMSRPVIVIADGEVKFPDTEEFEDTVLLPGDPCSEKKLRNANIQDAFAAIILSNEKHGEHADSRTVMVAMEIVNVVEMLAPHRLKGQNRLNISAEVIDPSKVKYLKRVGVTEVVSGGDISLKLLAQTAVTPGITHFMDDILCYSPETNEIYIVDPPEKLLEDGGASFPQIVEYLLTTRLSDNPVIPLGIQLAGDGVFLINPPADKFKKLAPGDRLMVMARYQPCLK